MTKQQFLEHIDIFPADSELRIAEDKNAIEVIHGPMRSYIDFNPQPAPRKRRSDAGKPKVKP